MAKPKKRPRGATGKRAPAKIEAARKRAQCVELRARGLTLAEIAAKVGYAKISTVSEAIDQGLRELGDPRKVADLRELSNRRLDMLLARHLPIALRDPAKAMREEYERSEDAMLATEAARVVDRALARVIAIEARRAKLNGLDMPSKSEISGPGGGPIPIGAEAILGMLRQLPDGELDALILRLSGGAPQGGGYGGPDA